jgi:hypothetical protein
MLDIRGSSPQLVAGHRHRDGIELSQNGEWDDTFLCDQHERLIGAGDDYAVRFIRRRLPAGKLQPDGRSKEVENPKPNQLMQFAYAVIWRHVVCESGRALGLGLGPYEKPVRSALLSGGPYDLELLVGINPLVLEGKSVQVAVGPYRDRMGNWNVWHFTIGGLDFYLKTDARRFPTSWRPYLANGNNPIVLGQTRPRGFHETPKLFPILRRMNQSTWK